MAGRVDRKLAGEVLDSLIDESVERALAFRRRRGRMPTRDECGGIVRRVLRGKLKKLAK